MLISCYTAIDDPAGRQRSAELTLKRAEAVLSRDQNNPRVTGFSVDALAALGEPERAKARIEHALMFDPDNWVLVWQFACSLNVQLHDKEAAIKLLGFVFERISGALMPYMKADPDFDSLHDDPRWQAMVAAAEVRLAAAKDSVTSAAATDSGN